MSEYDVELQSVTKRFGEIAAVDDVSFGIRKGEFFSLLGPSGCGKTTIMRMISGFETPTSGPPRRATPRSRRRNSGGGPCCCSSARRRRGCWCSSSCRSA